MMLNDSVLVLFGYREDIVCFQWPQSTTKTASVLILGQKVAHTAGSGPQEKHKVVKRKKGGRSLPLPAIIHSLTHPSLREGSGRQPLHELRCESIKADKFWGIDALSSHSPGFETSLGLFCVFMFSLCLRGFCRHSENIEFCFNSKIVSHSESSGKVDIYMCFSRSPAKSKRFIPLQSLPSG